MGTTDRTAGSDRDVAFAERVGLRYADLEGEVLTRRRRGKGFSFHGPDGDVVGGEVRERLLALAIPPAWTEVEIHPDPEAHLQVRGRDDAGRLQYRYHPRWTEARRMANFDRMVDVGERLGPVRRRVAEIVATPATEPEGRARRSCALMLAVVDGAMSRIGGMRSAREFEHFGVSTLRAEHVTVDGDVVHLAYPGKSGVDRDIELQDGELADALAQLVADVEDGTQRIFDVVAGDGRVHLTAEDANDLLRELSGGTMTCKDFRTWGASAVALEARQQGADEVDAVDRAAEALGNTRAVARSSYVHPTVLTAPAAMLDEVWSSSRGSVRHDRREQALVKLLDRTPSLLDGIADGPEAQLAASLELVA